MGEDDMAGFNPDAVGQEPAPPADPRAVVDSVFDHLHRKHGLGQQLGSDSIPGSGGRDETTENDTQEPDAEGYSQNIEDRRGPTWGPQQPHMMPGQNRQALPRERAKQFGYQGDNPTGYEEGGSVEDYEPMDAAVPATGDYDRRPVEG